MIFNATHIELDPADTYFVPEFGSHLGYNRSIELYLRLQACFDEALKDEFKAFDISRERSLSVVEAFDELSTAKTSETTYLAGKLVGLHSVLVNYFYEGSLD
jgi:hypothetical protein